VLLRQSLAHAANASVTASNADTLDIAGMVISDWVLEAPAAHSIAR
jgi:hypothetical protein